MIEKVIQVLSEVAGIGVFAIAIAEKAASLIRRLKAMREARRAKDCPEKK